MTEQEYIDFLKKKNACSIEKAIPVLFPFCLKNINYNNDSFDILLDFFGDPFFDLDPIDSKIHVSFFLNTNAVWDYLDLFYFKTEYDMIAAKMLLG